MAKLLELMALHSSKKVFGLIILLDCLSQQKSMANLLRNRQEDIAVTRTTLACIEAFELDGSVELIIGDATETIPNLFHKIKNF